jgi:hypothetical protein
MPPAFISQETSKSLEGFEVVRCMTARYNGWEYWWRSYQFSPRRWAGWHRMHKVE